MTDDVSQEVEAEEAAPRRKGVGFWVVLTVIFVVVSAVLAWLYTAQLDEVTALRAQAEQATTRAAMLQQANRRISGELTEVVSKLKEVVELVAELEEAYPSAETSPTEEEVSPAEAAEPKAAEEAKPAEEDRPELGQQRMPSAPGLAGPGPRPGLPRR